MEETNDIESNIPTCIICLEKGDENNVLKSINCNCKIDIHKKCLDEYLYNNNMEQKCPVCSNLFRPKYEVEYDIKFIDKLGYNMDKFFCKDYQNAILNFSCILSYIIIQIILIVSIFTLGIIGLCIYIILIG